MENVNEKVLSEISDAELNIKMEQLGAELNNTVTQLVGNTLLNSKVKKAKSGDLFKDNRNLIGGLVGVGIGVGLELLSPTGSVKSAAVAGVVGGGVLYLLNPYIDAVPQTTGLAAVTGGVTAYVSMAAGRITADYFPGNLSEEA